MKRIYRPPSRTSTRLISLAVCYSLLNISLAPFKAAGAGRSLPLRGSFQESTTPRAGAPEGILPNLDEVRTSQLPQPAAPPSVSSTMCSRRNPLAPRTVRHVGDPLPSPSILPSVSPLPSPSMSPLSSPLPLPSLLPTPSPLSSPSMSPWLLSLVKLGKTTIATPWTNGGNEDLLPYLLASNHSYPIPYQPGYSLSDLTGLNRNSSSLNWPAYARGSSDASFDFYIVPMPQAGSTRIVFTSNREGRAQIYSMDANGSNLIRLTNNGANDDHPRWSPNGTRILFQSDRDNPETGNYDVYVMNADGTGQTRLTTDAADDGNSCLVTRRQQDRFSKPSQWNVLPGLRNEC